jgi:hypothetical protein
MLILHFLLFHLQSNTYASSYDLWWVVIEGSGNCSFSRYSMCRMSKETS